MSHEEQCNASSAPTDTGEQTPGIADLRVERILEHIDNSVQQEDALQAAVGAAGADLMMIQYRMAQAIDEALRTAPDALTATAEILPSFNVYTKLSQQVGQFVQLSLKLKTENGVR